MLGWVRLGVKEGRILHSRLGRTELSWVRLGEVGLNRVKICIIE